MTKFIQEAVTDKGETSSARAINILGAVTGTILMLYHGIWLNTLSYDVLAVYLGYCSGTYAVGKYIGRRYNDADNMEYNERCKTTSNKPSRSDIDSRYAEVEGD